LFANILGVEGNFKDWGELLLGIAGGKVPKRIPANGRAAHSRLIPLFLGLQNAFYLEEIV
jgi:hypothetical protein